VIREKLAESAAAEIGPDEEVREVTRVRKGLVRQQNHALVATDANLYAFRLSWPGMTNVAEELVRVPLGDAELEYANWSITLRNRSTGEVHDWRRLKNNDPRALIEYVQARARG
jgi:hypothetical protein